MLKDPRGTTQSTGGNLVCLKTVSQCQRNMFGRTVGLVSSDQRASFFSAICSALMGFRVYQKYPNWKYSTCSLDTSFKCARTCRKILPIEQDD